GSPSRSMRCWSMTVALAGDRASCSGVRDAVMTIWSVSMGVTGISRILLLTNLSSQEGHALRSMADPGRETNDGPRQVSDSMELYRSVLQLRAQRRFSTGFLVSRRP